jgi:MOSC domain-containing protein YiiM
LTAHGGRIGRKGCRGKSGSSASVQKIGEAARSTHRELWNRGRRSCRPFRKTPLRARRTPERPNLRQIHLIQCELFSELRALGFAVQPGELGENVTTRDIDLLRLPLTCRLHLGASAVVELTGLRTPCGYIDRFQKGLKRTMIVKDKGVTFRAGVLGMVRHGGNVAPGDRVEVELPQQPWTSLPAL